jgi:integrase
MPGLTVQRQPNGIYRAVGTVAGERVRKSLRTRDEQRAKELSAHLETRIWQRHTYGEEAVKTFEEAAVSYLEAGGEKRFTAPLIVHFKGRPVGRITSGEIKDAARRLYPPARAILNHAHELGWRPPIKVSRFEEEKVERIAVDRGWLNAFMAEAQHRKLPHQAALALSMFQSAARLSEACDLEWEDVDLTARTALLRRTKNGEARMVHLSLEMTVVLAQLPRIKGKPVFLYASRHSAVKPRRNICAAAGIPYVQSHQAGRHSFGTEMRRRGVDPKTGMEAGGWKSARVYIETYVHAPDAGRTVADLFDNDLARPLALDGKGKENE